jgi:hypothetical protein
MTLWGEPGSSGIPVPEVLRERAARVGDVAFDERPGVLSVGDMERELVVARVDGDAFAVTERRRNDRHDVVRTNSPAALAVLLLPWLWPSALAKPPYAPMERGPAVRAASDGEVKRITWTPAGSGRDEWAEVATPGWAVLARISQLVHEPIAQLARSFSSDGEVGPFVPSARWRESFRDRPVPVTWDEWAATPGRGDAG